MKRHSLEEKLFTLIFFFFVFKYYLVKAYILYLSSVEIKIEENYL